MEPSKLVIALVTRRGPSCALCLRIHAQLTISLLSAVRLCVLQVKCEAKRVTDSVSIKGICSLIPVAKCCEPENPEEGLVFVRTLRDDRRREKLDREQEDQQ